jgi:hypothetical protein
VADQSDRLGSSGVFKALVDGARKFGRAVTGGDQELTPESNELGNKIGRAFVANKFEDVYALGTPSFQKRLERAQFAGRWRDAVKGRGPFTGYEVARAGEIDLGFIPGLEETPQSQFVAFLEIVFSSPGVGLDDDKAFTIGAVLLDEDGQVRLGALHTD